MFLTPGVTPWITTLPGVEDGGNNPGIRIFEYDTKTLLIKVRCTHMKISVFILQTLNTFTHLFLVLCAPKGYSYLLSEPDICKHGTGALGEGVPSDGGVSRAGRLSCLHAPRDGADNQRQVLSAEVFWVQLGGLWPDGVPRWLPCRSRVRGEGGWLWGVWALRAEGGRIVCWTSAVYSAAVTDAEPAAAQLITEQQSLNIVSQTGVWMTCSHQYYSKHYVSQYRQLSLKRALSPKWKCCHQRRYFLKKVYIFFWTPTYIILFSTDIWSDRRVNKWQNLNFWGNCPFKSNDFWMFIYFLFY